MALYLTNPVLSDFEKYIERKADNSIKASSMTSDDDLGEFIGLLSKAYINIATTRNDYYICSIYTIEGIDDDYYFLGIFKQFIPIPI